MKFNTTIPHDLKSRYLKELELYRSSLQNNNLLTAWHHLERSHILGQSYPLEHTYTHWLMLKFGLRQRNTKEVLGQVIAALGWWLEIIYRPRTHWKYRWKRCATIEKNGNARRHSQNFK